MDDMRRACSHIVVQLFIWEEKFVAKEGMIPNHLHSSHACNTGILRYLCPSNNPLWIPANAPSVLGTWQVSCGIVHCDSSWVLLAVGQQLSSDHNLQGLTPLRVGHFWCQSSISQCMGAIPWIEGYVKGGFPLWDYFPIWLVQMTVLVPAAHQLTLCSQTVTPSCCCYGRTITFASVVPIPSSPYWQGSLK